MLPNLFDALPAREISNLSKDDSRYDVSGLPIRKCPGVNGKRSAGSDDVEIIDREFKIASI